MRTLLLGLARWCWLCVLVLSASDALAFNTSEGNLKQVYDVRHENQELVASDKVYKMAIGLKVFIEDSEDKPFRTVNRYALKPGQSIYMDTRYQSKRYYVDRILIINGGRVNP